MVKKTITRKSLAKKQPRVPNKVLTKVISGEKKYESFCQEKNPQVS